MKPNTIPAGMFELFQAHFQQILNLDQHLLGILCRDPSTSRNPSGLIPPRCESTGNGSGGTGLARSGKKPSFLGKTDDYDGNRLSMILFFTVNIKEIASIY